MIPENRIPTHPGVILGQEFLAPLGISQVAFAAHLGVPVQRINELIRGKRGITADTALRLARRFKMSPQFWMRPQRGYRALLLEQWQELVDGETESDPRSSRPMMEQSGRSLDVSRKALAVDLSSSAQFERGLFVNRIDK